MLSRQELKMIRALHRRKERDKQGLFLAEGAKLVDDLLRAGLKPRLLLTTTELPPPYVPVSPEEMKTLSLLETPSPRLGIFHKPVAEVSDAPFILALDQVRDPGNLGTILRTAAWFGLKNITLGKGTVDPYNPKTVQASMGAIAGIVPVETNLPEAISQWKAAGYRVLGADMNGTPVFSQNFVWPERTVLVMGNEGEGLSAEIRKLITQTVSIPGAEGSLVESLNVSLATGILLADRFRRGMPGGGS